MPSVIKVDQIQSDTGNVAISGNVSFSAGSAAVPAISPTGDTNTGIFFPAADTIAFAEDGVESGRFDSAGNFLIGSTTTDGFDGASGIKISRSVATGILLEQTAAPARQWLTYVTGSSGSLNIYDSTANAERVSIDTNGNFLFNSGYGSIAVAYGCRSWISFNGSGTIAIRGSGNVSSITDHGTGQYAVNMATAMPDANYSIPFSISDAGGGGTSSMYGYIADSSAARTTSSYRIVTLISNGSTFFDAQYINTAVFR